MFASNSPEACGVAGGVGMATAPLQAIDAGTDIGEPAMSAGFSNRPDAVAGAKLDLPQADATAAWLLQQLGTALAGETPPSVFCCSRAAHMHAAQVACMACPGTMHVCLCAWGVQRRAAVLVGAAGQAAGQAPHFPPAGSNQPRPHTAGHHSAPPHPGSKAWARSPVTVLPCRRGA